MKKVKYVYENEVETFKDTLEQELELIHRAGFDVMSIHILSDSTTDGFRHSAYIIYDSNEPVVFPPPRTPRV